VGLSIEELVTTGMVLKISIEVSTTVLWAEAMEEILLVEWLIAKMSSL